MKADKTNKDSSSPMGVTKGEKKRLMNVAEVRMLFYVVPIATVLALFVYIITR